MEYADFVFDYDIKYINKKWQTIQNQGLYIVFDQHYLTYDLRESTEALHRRASIVRLAHRRYIHMLSFIYNYRHDQALVDVREIQTRRHDGILFSVVPTDHYKVKQDPLYRAIQAWNNLPINLRNINTKEIFKRELLNGLENPYAKLYN